MNSLELDSVQLSFDGRKLLSNIYLKCETGNIIGILGRNGCGKSSLLKIIFGSLKAQEQSLRLNGKYVDQPFCIPKTIHLAPQDGFLMNYLKVDDLIRVFRLEAHLDKLMEVEEFGRNRQNRIGNVSGGEKKAIEILTLLYTESKFTLLDEPFSYLSPVLVEKIIPHIRGQSKHKGIILTDHQYRTVWVTANKYYTINHGILTQLFKIKDLEAFGYLTTET